MRNPGDRLANGALLGLLVLAVVNGGEKGVASAGSAVRTGHPLAKNVILMISDGWGFSHLEVVSYFEYGREARQIFDRFPFQCAMTTFMAYDEGDSCRDHGYDPALAWSDFDYVKACATDSAAAATAMSTGVKTYSGAIGVDLEGFPLPHALEFAEALGKATGVVTSVPLSHATPAAFVAHNESRENYAQIASEMIRESAVDVILGAGHPWYDNDGHPLAAPNTFKYVGGEATWNDLVAGVAGGDADGDGVPDPWVLVQSRDEFQALGSGSTPARILGVPQVFETLQQRRSGNAHAAPFVVPPVTTVPTLAEMTRAALNILDDDPDGLFLVVEGGAVDWASHAHQSGRMIEEAIDFERAVDEVVEWVRRHGGWGDTLLVITGDHETGYLTGPGSDPGWMPILNHGAGNLPGMEWHSDSHTNSLIAVSAKGDAARKIRHLADESDPVRGPYLDNTEIATILFGAMTRNRPR